MNVYHTVIIGAGISGLSAAVSLQHEGIEKDKLLVLEKANRPGGLIHTTSKNGYISEWGPEGLRGKSENTKKIFELAGLDPVAASNEAKLRYLIKNHKLVSLPTGLFSALSTPIISLKGKLRLLKEPFVKANPDDETVEQFISRRFGKSVTPIVDAFVSGIYGGDHTKSSVKYSFPFLKSAETSSGSVVKGMMSSAKKKKNSSQGKIESNKKADKPFLYVSDTGMEGLIKSLARQVNVSYDSTVEKIEKKDELYEVQTVSGDTYYSENIIVSTGSVAATKISIMGKVLPKPPNVSYVTVVSLGYDVTAFENPPIGYGFLSPSGEKTFVLGVLFSSKLFNHRAPDNKILLRCFVGGARYPERSTLDDSILIEEVTKELSGLLGAKGSPEFVEVHRQHPQGIPQFTLDHSSIIEWKEKMEKENPGLYLSGIGWNSIACDGLLSESFQITDQILRSENHIIPIQV